MTIEQLVSRQAIDKGWSGDRKFCAMDAQGQKYLLRISPAEQYERKRQEYELSLQVAALGVPMCRPIAFGTCEQGVYAIHSWIDAQDAENVIPSMPPQTQYAVGLEAGRILSVIHRLPAPKGLDSWECRYGRKMDRKLDMYASCPVHYDQGHLFVQYVKNHRHLIRGRSQTYQHGDYHIGNMMIDKAGQLWIIDFDRRDFGDPWEEFNRIVWCAQAAPMFASGMVDGYFDSNPPLAFWELLALYIATNTLSSLPWAIPYGDKEIAVMQRQAQEILGWYQNMTAVIPTWYHKA